MTRSNIHFGSLDVCIPDKIDDGTTAKPRVRLLTKQTTSISSVGEGRAPPEISVTAADPSMAARRFMKHELWLQKSVALD